MQAKLRFGLAIKPIDVQGAPNHRWNYNGKELEESTQWYEYGQRDYDAQIGRFYKVDRFAEKYMDMRPYQYAGNNPIMNIDVNGDSIMGNHNQSVTYTIDQESGKATWSENVTADVQKVGNALLQTKKGKEMLDEAIGSDIKISISISSKDNNNPNRRGVTQYAGISEDSDGKMTAESASITIYEETIEGLVKNGETDYAKLLRGSELMFDNQGVAATVAHEIFHTTDRDNRNISIRAGLKITSLAEKQKYVSQREKIPNQINTTVAAQAYQRMGNTLIKLVNDK